MNIGIGLLFFISHVLGDFYYGSRRITNELTNKYKGIIKHSIIYQIFFLFLFIFIGFNTKFIVTIFVIGISHYIVDSIIFLIQTKHFVENTVIKNKLFFIDQIIHVIIIFLCIGYLKSETFASEITLKIFNNNYYFIRLIFAFLLIGKPSNIIFKKIFTRFKPASVNETATEDETFNSAGAAIGTLERILILICIINQLYSSIGLILTAKSIARYNRISNEPAFSEYYLLGTLSSVLSTIIVYIISFNLF